MSRAISWICVVKSRIQVNRWLKKEKRLLSDDSIYLLEHVADATRGKNQVRVGRILFQL
jgi:hypothetical protein